MAAAHQNHFHGYIEREVKRWLTTLLVDPEKFHPNTRELTGRIISTLSWDDAAQGKAYGDSAHATLTQMSVSGPVVNTMTPLWHLGDLFRFNPWREYEVEREGTQRAWWLQSIRLAKKKFKEGRLAENTWAYRYFEQLVKAGNISLEQSEKEEDFAACMLGFQCLVGVITIAGPLEFFLMAMALHPEWLGKCQEEIDRVCGDKMPDIGDFADLPTVRACLKETLRWRSGVPLGEASPLCILDMILMLHARDKADGRYSRCASSVREGPQLPRRHNFQGDHHSGVRVVSRETPVALSFHSLCIPNGRNEASGLLIFIARNINRVPDKYPDPEHYRPDRYLDPSFPTYQEPLTRYPNFRDGKSMHTFGWGRRACLGQNLVDDELFVAGAAVCWAFDMGPKKCPSTGKDITFDTQATNSNVILEPKPFPMQFKVRSEERAQKIVQQYAEVRSELRV